MERELSSSALDLDTPESPFRDSVRLSALGPGAFKTPHGNAASAGDPGTHLHYFMFKK
jgi:hypothetical protein